MKYPASGFWSANAPGSDMLSFALVERPHRAIRPQVKKKKEGNENPNCVTVYIDQFDNAIANKMSTSMSYNSTQQHVVKMEAQP